jgi:hypothetical protein
VAAHRLSCQLHRVGCRVVTKLAGWQLQGFVDVPNTLLLMMQCKQSSWPSRCFALELLHDRALRTSHKLSIHYLCNDANMIGILTNNIQ